MSSFINGNSMEVHTSSEKNVQQCANVGGGNGGDAGFLSAQNFMVQGSSNEMDASRDDFPLSQGTIRSRMQGTAMKGMSSGNVSENGNETLSQGTIRSRMQRTAMKGMSSGNVSENGNESSTLLSWHSATVGSTCRIKDDITNEFKTCTITEKHAEGDIAYAQVEMVSDKRIDRSVFDTGNVFLEQQKQMQNELHTNAERAAALEKVLKKKLEDLENREFILRANEEEFHNEKLFLRAEILNYKKENTRLHSNYAYVKRNYKAQLEFSRNVCEELKEKEKDFEETLKQNERMRIKAEKQSEKPLKQMSGAELEDYFRKVGAELKNVIENTV